MAEVYRCKLVGQQGFEKIIVLKKLLSEAAQDQERVTNFIDEARLAALLQHENIGHVYDFGEIDGNYFIAMEYLFGKDLFTIVQQTKKNRKSIDIEPALFIASKICEGMGYAHSLKDLQGKPLNIIHRDLTPHNVFVTYDGKVKIIDFGVARAELFDNRTKAGVVKGKVSYMSPEQLTEESVDQRSDIFSIGILLYEMLSGKRMYEGDTATLIRKGMQADYDRLESIAPALPREVYGIVDKALQADRSKRYQTCEEMAAAIDDFLYQLKERPSSQKLKSFMRGLFCKEYETESKKLIETVNKFDEIHGVGQKTGTTAEALTGQVEPEDKTVVMTVPPEAPKPEKKVEPQKKVSEKPATKEKEKSSTTRKATKASAGAAKTTKAAATPKKTQPRATKTTAKTPPTKSRPAKAAAGKPKTTTRTKKTPPKSSKPFVKFLASLAVIGVLLSAVYYAVVEKGEGVLVERVKSYQSQTLEKLNTIIERGKAKFALSDEKVAELVKQAEEVLANESLGVDRLVESAHIFKQVLQARSDNDPALAGLQEIYDEYGDLLKKYLSDKEFAKAEEVIQSAEEALPGSKKVALLRTESRTHKQQLIDQLREKAERALDSNDLTTPEDRSAYTYFTEILEIDADNDTAKQGLRRIAEKYFSMAEVSYRNLSLSQAQIYSERGLNVLPDYKPLLDAAEEIPPKYIELVEKYIDENDFSRASDLAEEAQEVYPNNKRIAALLPAVIIKKEQLVRDWQQKGDMALKNDDLTTPLESSAYTYYTKILEVDSDNTAAQDGIRRVAERYATLATAAFRNLDLPRVKMYVERGLMVEPQHPRLLAIQGDIFTEYDNLVNESLRKNRLAEAAEYVSSLRKVFPRDKRVSSLSSKVETRKRELIKGYRLKAQRALSKNNLTTPTDDSAYTFYRRILQIDSNNTVALNGLQRIGDKYASMADDSQRKRKTDEARVYVARGLKVVPNHKRLLQLKTQLTKSKPVSIFRALKESIDSAF